MDKDSRKPKKTRRARQPKNLAPKRDGSVKGGAPYIPGGAIVSAAVSGLGIVNDGSGSTKK